MHKEGPEPTGSGPSLVLADFLGVVFPLGLVACAGGGSSSLLASWSADLYSYRDLVTAFV
jgi:hypothetical protein